MGQTVKPLAAGDLRFPITVEQPRKATPPDTDGHIDGTDPDNWTEFCCRRAKVQAIGAREVLNPDGSVLIALTTYEMRVRYDSVTKDIKKTMRVRWEGKIINLETAYDPDMTKRQILMTGVEEESTEQDGD
jgi:head-tail adaptor